jgi:hypothetical protein
MLIGTASSAFDSCSGHKRPPLEVVFLIGNLCSLNLSKVFLIAGADEAIRLVSMLIGTASSAFDSCSGHKDHLNRWFFNYGNTIAICRISK